MAGLGTIYVELSLDDKVYKQKLSETLTSTQTTAKGAETAWKALGARCDAVYEAQKKAAVNAYTLIKNSALSTTNDIIRAEAAKVARIKTINEQQYGHQTTMLEGLKKNWIAASVAIGAAVMAAGKAMAYMEEGAKALQIESSFKIMSDAAGVSSEKIISSMRAATKETIDDSDMMQKAVKLMTLGYNPEQIERFSKVVITASQIAGTTAAEAYNGLADAIANRMPKALVRMGAVTKEQMKIVNKAIEAGADSTVLFELAMANLELKQKMLQGTQDGATLAIQRFHAQVKETKEELGKGLIYVLSGLYGELQLVASAALIAAGGLAGLAYVKAKYDSTHETDKDKAAIYAANAAAYRKMSDDMFGAAEKLAKLGKGNLFKDGGDGSAKASKDAIAGAQAEVDAQMKSLKAYAAKGKAVKEAAQETEAATKKALEETRKANAEIEGVGKSQFEKDVARINSEGAELSRQKVDDVIVYKWAMAQLELANGKAYEAMAKNAREESDKAIDAMKADVEMGVKTTKESIDRIKERGHAARDMYKDMKGYEQDYYNESLKLIDEQVTRFKDAALDEIAIEKWKEEQKRLAGLQLKRSVVGAGTFSEGWDEGAKDWGKDVNNMFVQGEKMAKATATAMSSSFSDFFFDAIKGECKSFQDYFQSFSDAILKAFTDMLADMVAKWIMETAKMTMQSAGNSLWSLAGSAVGATGGAFGGSAGALGDSGSLDNVTADSVSAFNFHTGGVVGQTYKQTLMPAYAFAGAPRLHAGFAPDEFPAILQRGEAVIPRKQVKAAQERGGGSLSISVPITGIDNKKMVADLKNSIESAVVSVIKRHS